MIFFLFLLQNSRSQLFQLVKNPFYTFNPGLLKQKRQQQLVGPKFNLGSNLSVLIKLIFFFSFFIYYHIFFSTSSILATMAYYNQINLQPKVQHKKTANLLFDDIGLRSNLLLVNHFPLPLPPIVNVINGFFLLFFFLYVTYIDIDRDSFLHFFMPPSPVSVGSSINFFLF